MSLDGYVSGPGESGFEHLFAWYSNGDVVVPTSDPNMTLTMTEESAEHFRNLVEMSGAIIVGRHLFDMMNGWGGTHPMGVPVVVLSHTVPEGWPREGADFHFVTTGIEDAVATASKIAGDKVVGVNAGTIASQCLNAGLLDEVWIDLVPVMLGGGTSFFSDLLGAPILLEDPIVKEGKGVTHLRYRVRK